MVQLRTLGLVCVLLAFGSLDASSVQATLLGINSAREFLAEIDPETGVVTQISPDYSIGTDAVALTYDGTTDTLYGVGSNRVITIDRMTGVGSVLSSVGGASTTMAVHFDTSTNTLYAVDGYLDDRLVRIDPATGSVSEVGVIGFEGVNAMTRHLGNGNLYAIANNSQMLLTIDPSTGLGTPVASLSSSNFGALAYLPETGQLLGLNFAQLVEIDIATGSLTAIGSPFTSLETLAYVPEPSTALLLALGLITLARRPRSH